MTSPKRPPAPSSLQETGRALWRSVVADVAPSWTLDRRDLATLEQACACADMIDRLTSLIDGGDLTDTAVHRAVVELRQQRLTLSRLLSMVDLDERTVSTPVQRRAQHAARARWGSRTA